MQLVVDFCQSCSLVATNTQKGKKHDNAGALRNIQHLERIQVGCRGNVPNVPNVPSATFQTKDKSSE